MPKKIYIGNLSYATTEDGLRQFFAPYGEILSATIIMDQQAQRSKGFGFVVLADEAMLERAIAGLNGRELDGRRVRVSMAEEKPPRQRRPLRENYSRDYDSDKRY